MEKLEIIINEMMADDGPVPMDMENVGTHDAKTTPSDQDTSSDMSFEDVCAIAGKGYKAGKGARRDQTDRGHGIVEKELMNGRVAEEMTERKEARRAPRAPDLTGTVRRTEEAQETQAKANAIVKPDTATSAESKGTSE